MEIKVRCTTSIISLPPFCLQFVGDGDHGDLTWTDMDQSHSCTDEACKAITNLLRLLVSVFAIFQPKCFEFSLAKAGQSMTKCRYVSTSPSSRQL